MKQKILTILLALTASVGMTFAQSGKCGENLTWTLSDGVLTIDGTGAMTNFSSNSVPWYSYRGSITEVVIGENVTTIGICAFEGYSSLTSVTIPNSVTSIGGSAFYGCSKLTSVTIPNSVTSIGEWAFFNCSSLTSVTIGESVTSIGNYAFLYCTSLTSVTIPNSVTSIGVMAFYGCSSLPVIDNIRYADMYLVGAVDKTLSIYTIKEGTKWIGEYAFLDCSSLTSVTILNSVTSIGSDAFSGCSGLTSVTIPNSVTSIGNSAFYGCSSLTSVTIPNSVTSIGQSTFSGCSSLTSITIPNSVTTIGGSAFSYCSSLTSITIPNSVTSIGDYAFSGCSSLTSVIWNAKKCNDFSFDNTMFYKSGSFDLRTQITSFTFGDNVEYIPAYLCSEMSNMTSVTIGKNVTSIGELSFIGCSGLTSVHISDIAAWCKITFGSNPLSYAHNLYLNGTLVTDLVIPNSVTSIGSYAFYGCNSLKDVVLGASVKVLEAGAFSNCSAIETITCYSMRPPTVKDKALEGLPYTTIVYVPADAYDTYNMHNDWGLYDVRPMGAASTETEDVQVTPTETTADVVWPSVDGAATYELVIKDKGGNVICTLVFNVKGQLTSIAFNAPDRDRSDMPEQAQSAGFSFTVTGLKENTEYTYTLTAKDSKGKAVDTKTGTFKTIGVATPVDETERDAAPAPRKQMKNGILRILTPNGITYTAQGQRLD